jgi:purine nucleosidase
MRIFLDHDGGIDDFLALLILLSHEDVELLGISITPADTCIEAAAPATRKILDLAGRSDTTVAVGTLEGPNPFPSDWRLDSYKVDALPVLNQTGRIVAPLSDLAGHEYLATSLMAQPTPVNLLMVGPLTNLAWALDHHPGVATKIDRLYWMGGALEVPGNVNQDGHDGTAEWNAFWDPPAVARVWDTDIPITMFPLDATNQVPLDAEFIHAFGPLYRHPLAAAAGTIWALTNGHVHRTGIPYYAWDTLTAAAMLHPELCTYREVRCGVVTEGASQGRTVPTSSGRLVLAADRVDADAFRTHCLETLQQ